MLKQHVLAAPRVVERPPQRMAVIETVGDPDEVGARGVGALYGAIAQLGLNRVRCARAGRTRRPRRRSEWVARWALPVPDHTPELGGGIVLETWYGRLTAEIVHEGAFGDAEIATVKRLHRFIHDCGYEIDGPPRRST